jgi:hypothetical protein
VQRIVATALQEDLLIPKQTEALAGADEPQPSGRKFEGVRTSLWPVVQRAAPTSEPAAIARAKS